MALLDIHVLGAPVLREPTLLVETVTDELRRLVDDMFETMHVAKGIGLAAPQVGRRERLFVTDVDDHPLVFFNPEIVLAEGKAKGEEGCLSIPDVYGDVSRPMRVVVRALDRDGKPFELSADGLLARCLQHEIDHLDGRLFVDHLGVLRRKAAMAKWATLKGKYPGHIRTLSAEEIAAHHERDDEL